jgi:UDP-glucose 4-epimerase
MKKYLVTGGAGFIGSAIAKRLLESDNIVYIIDNLKTGYLENIPEGAIFIEGDFSKDETLDRLENIRFDAIFHIGGQSSGEISFEDPEYDLNTNTLSTLKLLQYAKETNSKKFIYASTMSVYGEDGKKEQFSEEDRTEPKSFYAVGKLASEKYLSIFQREYGIDYTALRYFNVYGEGQNLENLKQGMVSIYLKQFFDNEFREVEVKGSLERFRDLIYIDDVVDITISALDNPKFKNQIVNVGTGKKTTVREILELIKKQSSIDKKIVVTSGTKGDQFGIYADITKLKSIYKKELTPFEVGLERMIEWVKELKPPKESLEVYP